jgi:hypothetical protein
MDHRIARMGSWWLIPSWTLPRFAVFHEILPFPYFASRQIKDQKVRGVTVRF